MTKDMDNKPYYDTDHVANGLSREDWVIKKANYDAAQKGK